MAAAGSMTSRPGAGEKDASHADLGRGRARKGPNVAARQHANKEPMSGHGDPGATEVNQVNGSIGRGREQSSVGRHLEDLQNSLEPRDVRTADPGLALLLMPMQVERPQQFASYVGVRSSFF